MVTTGDESSNLSTSSTVPQLPPGGFPLLADGLPASLPV